MPRRVAASHYSFIYVYIYINRERERYREREICTHTHMYVCIYIYIYVCTYVLIVRITMFTHITIRNPMSASSDRRPGGQGGAAQAEGCGWYIHGYSAEGGAVDRGCSGLG